jgi:8-oxo-dGTP diphosphatase
MGNSIVRYRPFKTPPNQCTYRASMAAGLVVVASRRRHREQSDRSRRVVEPPALHEFSNGFNLQRMPDIVNAVLLRKDEVLLAKRSPMRKAYAGRWSFPGGHVEEGEDFEQALHRELQEEIGIVPVEYRKLAPITDPHTKETIYRMYAVTAWHGDPRIRDQEHSELKWFKLDAAGRLAGLALEAYRPLFAELAIRHS